MPVNTSERHHVHDETAGGDGIATGVYVDQRVPAPPRYLGVTQRVVISNATGGNFKLYSGGHETANIAYDAEPSAVAAALNGLPSVGSAAVDEVQTITVDATSGTYTLTFGGHETAGIAFDAAASAVKSALVALAGIESVDVDVQGSAGGPYTVTFTGALGGANQPLLVANSTSLAGNTHTATVAQQTAGHPIVAGVAVTGSEGDYVVEFVGPPDPTITATDTLTGTGHAVDVVTL